MQSWTQPFPGAPAAEALDRLTEVAARLVGGTTARIVLGPVPDALPLVVRRSTELDGAALDLPAGLTEVPGACVAVPLVGSDGGDLGALWVLSAAPRDWSDDDVRLLGRFAPSVVAELELARFAPAAHVGRLAWEVAIDAAGVGTFDWDLATGQLAWDDRLLEMFGYARSTFTETIEAFSARLHQDDRARVDAAIASALATCGPYQADFRIVLPSGALRWIAARGRALPGPDGAAERLVGAALDTTEQRAVSRRETARAALLADVTSQLVGTLDPEEGVARLAQLICPALADWCVITLVGDDPASYRDLRDLGWWHADPRLLPLVERYAETRMRALGPNSHLARVLRTGEPIVMTSGARETISGLLRPGPAQQVLAELAPGAGAVLPLRGRGGIVGVLSVFNGPSRALTSDVLATLHEIADRAGLAVDNARLYAQQRDLAQGLQRSLLTEPPRRDGLEIAVRYAPAAAAAQVGGDWYDVFVHREGGTSFVIGDVVGHDTAAVAAMGQLRGLLRGIALSSDDGPLGVVTKLDEVVVGLEVDVTATAVVARLEEGRLRWANAGHPPPVLLPADGGAPVALGPPDADLLLGIDPATPRHEHEIKPAPGDVLLLYTDGLVERRGQSLDEGYAVLAATLDEVRHLSADELCDQLLARLLPARPEDDVAVLAVRLLPEPQ